MIKYILYVVEYSIDTRYSTIIPKITAYNPRCHTTRYSTPGVGRYTRYRMMDGLSHSILGDIVVESKFFSRVKMWSSALVGRVILETMSSNTRIESSYLYRVILESSHMCRGILESRIMSKGLAPLRR